MGDFLDSLVSCRLCDLLQFFLDFQAEDGSSQLVVINSHRNGLGLRCWDGVSIEDGIEKSDLRMG